MGFLKEPDIKNYFFEDKKLKTNVTYYKGVILFMKLMVYRMDTISAAMG